MSLISFFKHKYCATTLRGCGAAVTGVAIVGVLVVGVALLGGRDDVPSAHLARNKMQFPENEKMLDHLSQQLLQDAHISPAQGAGETLNAIAPAAGDKAIAPAAGGQK